MIDFLTIILLIFGVLQIILFFKVWGMTNDIKDIRNKYLKDEDEKQRKNTEHANTPRNNNDAKIHRKSIIQSFWESFFHVNKKFICHFYSKELLLREIVNQ